MIINTDSSAIPIDSFLLFITITSLNREHFNFEQQLAVGLDAPSGEATCSIRVVWRAVNSRNFPELLIIVRVISYSGCGVNSTWPHTIPMTPSSHALITLPRPIWKENSCWPSSLVLQNCAGYYCMTNKESVVTFCDKSPSFPYPVQWTVTCCPANFHFDKRHMTLATANLVSGLDLRLLW